MLIRNKELERREMLRQIAEERLAGKEEDLALLREAREKRNVETDSRQQTRRE